MTKRKRRQFTDEFKEDTVRLIRESGKTVAEIARDLDLSESAVRNWVIQAEIDEGRGGQGELTTAERQELQRLRRENKQLQMERENLKKPSGAAGWSRFLPFDTPRVRTSQDSILDPRFTPSWALT